MSFDMQRSYATDSEKSESSTQIASRNPSSETTNSAIDIPSEQALNDCKPADRGIHAYLFLLGSFFIEAFVWGFPLGFGVFQEYYSMHPPFQGNTHIATINTTATGLMYLSLPLWFVMAARYPQWRRTCQALGLVINVVGLLGSSFATTVPQLIATQGVLYGIGGAVIYTYVIIYLDEWFEKKKGLAFGVVWAGQGFAGAVVPPVMQALLNKCGYQTALRVWTIATIVLLGPLLYAIKPRLPQKKVSCNVPELRFTSDPAWIILNLGNVVQSLGFFIPSIYLPTYATTLGASDFVAASTALAFNLASVLGCVAIGHMIDRWHVTTCTTICAIGASASVFLLWGLSTKMPVIFVFSVVYGLTAGSASATWSGVIGVVRKHRPGADWKFIFPTLALGRGIGNIACGPISETLLTLGTRQGDTMGYQTELKPLIIFVGVTAFCAGLTIIGRFKKGLLD